MGKSIIIDGEYNGRLIEYVSKRDRRRDMSLIKDKSLRKRMRNRKDVYTRSATRGCYRFVNLDDDETDYTSEGEDENIYIVDCE